MASPLSIFKQVVNSQQCQLKMGIVLQSVSCHVYIVIEFSSKILRSTSLCWDVCKSFLGIQFITIIFRK